MPVDLSINSGEQSVLDCQWSHKQLRIFARVAPARCQIIKQFTQIINQVLLTGKQPNIGIEPGGSRVVVASAKMCVTTKPAFLREHHN